MPCIESTIQIPKTDVDELGTSTLLEEVLQEEVDSVISQDSVQSCPLGEQNVKVSYNKDNVNFVISTEELPSHVTNLEITVDTQQIKVDITDEKHANELSTASEVLTVSPVPIQVAESVLQVELKESMSNSQTMGNEILSSTITPVHESNISCSGTSSDPEKNTQINNSASVIESTQNVEKLEPNTIKSVEIIDTIDKLNDSCEKATKASQILTASEQSEFTNTVTSPLSSPSSSSVTMDTKTPRKCPNKNFHGETKLVQQVEESDTPTRKETELPIPPSESNVVEPSLSKESPIRPSRAKELSQSSKNVQESSLQEKEKVTKKSVKKSLEKSVSEGEPTEMVESDVSGKKVVKKVVKKVAKKSKAKPEEGLDDGAEETNSASKPKKTVKVVKKGTKSAQTLDTDAPVSENPSSSTSDTPIPPKRKTKASATKSVVKKSDIE